MRKFVMAVLFLVVGVAFSEDEPVGAVIAYPVKVVDGDTLDVVAYGGLVYGDGETDLNGQRCRVRLIGVDTPERGEKGFEEAKAFLHEEVMGGVKGGRILVLSVGIEDGLPVRDRYDRVLGVLSWSSDETYAESVNSRIVSGGYGKVLDIRGHRGVNYLTRKVHGGIR